MSRIKLRMAVFQKKPDQWDDPKQPAYVHSSPILRRTFRKDSGSALGAEKAPLHILKNNPVPETMEKSLHWEERLCSLKRTLKCEWRVG